MPIVVQCEGCGTANRFPDTAVGKRASCKKCGEVIRIGGTGSRTGGRNVTVEEDDVPVSFPEDVSAKAGDAGVFRPNPGRADSSKASSASGKKEGEADALEIVFIPARLALRVCLLALLLTPIFFAGKASLGIRILACFMWIVITGTYHTAKIEKEWFKSRFHFAFVPLASQKCKLASVEFVDAKYATSGPGWMYFILLGPIQWACGWLFEALIPAIGGPYQLHLVTAKGREIFAWRGQTAEQFQKNLDVLTLKTKAEIRSR